MGAHYPSFDYTLKRQTLRFGSLGDSKRPLEIEIESIEDLDKTIDELFDFLLKQGRPELLEELCPYFGVIWPSARALTEYLAEHLGSLESRPRILELGCGLALPSLLAAKSGADVISSDFHPEVERFLARNRALNGVSGPRFIPIPWDSSESAPRDERIPPDLDWIIASDVLYERQHPEILAKTLARYCDASTQVLVADPGRPYLQNFADAMARLGFKHETLIRPVEGSKGTVEIFLLVLKKS